MVGFTLTYISCSAKTTLERGTRIYIEYIENKEVQEGTSINFIVRKNVKEKGIVIIQKGAKGKLIIADLGGISGGQLNEASAHVIRKNGQKIELLHKSPNNKTAKGVFKVASFGVGMMNPARLAATTAAKTTATETINHKKLPKKLYVKHDTIIEHHD